MQPVTITNDIRQAILASGKSRYRIAVDANVAHSTLSRFMTGKAGLSGEAIDRLAGALQLVLLRAEPDASAVGKVPKAGASPRRASRSTKRRR